MKATVLSHCYKDNPIQPFYTILVTGTVGEHELEYYHWGTRQEIEDHSIVGRDYNVNLLLQAIATYEQGRA